MPSREADSGATARAASEPEGAPVAETWYLGEFVFEPETGELSPVDGAGEAARLPPQPSRLLRLLVERRGGVVTREEIRRHLWPDVEVDFDQGLHFCVRQIRAALGDSASKPRYVETLPRRGYRLVPGLHVEACARRAGASDKPSKSGLGGSRNTSVPGLRTFLLTAMAAALVASGGWWLVESRRMAPATVADATTGGPDRVAKAEGIPTLAIMSFRPPDDFEIDTRPIADLLLARLGALGPERLEVVGPTTTGLLDTDLRTVHAFLEERGIEYALNGRFASFDGEPRQLFVELIRHADGVHLWVERFPDPTDPVPIAARVAEATTEALGLEDGPARQGGSGD